MRLIGITGPITRPTERDETLPGTFLRLEGNVPCAVNRDQLFAELEALSDWLRLRG
jgi:hypothetical protein